MKMTGLYFYSPERSSATSIQERGSSQEDTVCFWIDRVLIEYG